MQPQTVMPHLRLLLKARGLPWDASQRQRSRRRQGALAHLKYLHQTMDLHRYHLHPALRFPAGRAPLRPKNPHGYPRSPPHTPNRGLQCLLSLRRPPTYRNSLRPPLCLRRRISECSYPLLSNQAWIPRDHHQSLDNRPHRRLARRNAPCRPPRRQMSKRQ